MTTTLVEPFFTEVNSYIGLREAIRRRVSTLDISRTTLDEITGLPLGYSGKLLATGEAKDPKRFGPLSLDLLLQATGLKLLVVDDYQTLAKFAPMYVKRDARQARPGNQCRKNTKAKRRKSPAPATKRLWSGRLRLRKAFSFHQIQGRALCADFLLS